MVALSVSMSAITCPEATLSPTLTCHLTTVPCSIVSERRGIVTLIGIGILFSSCGSEVVCGTTNSFSNLARVRQVFLLKVRGIRGRHIRGMNAVHVVVKIVKAVAMHL